MAGRLIARLLLLCSMFWGCTATVDSGAVDTIKSKATAELLAGRYENAEHLLSSAIKLAPNRADLHLLLLETARKQQHIPLIAVEKELLNHAELLQVDTINCATWATVDLPGLTPEGIAFDSTSGSLLLSSICMQTIYRADTTGMAIPLFSNRLNVEFSFLGMKLDGDSLWACCSLIPLCDSTLADSYGRSALCLIDLSSGQLIQAFYPPDSRKSIHVNDLALLPNGELIVTAYASKELYRLRRGSESLELFQTNKPLVKPNGIAVSQNGEVLYVATESGIVRVTFPSGVVSPLPAPAYAFSAGTDGLYWYDQSLIAVQQGYGLSRIVRYILSPAGDSIQEVRTILPNRPEQGQLTTAVISGNQLFCVLDAQWKGAQAGRDEPYRIGRLTLTP